MKSEKKIPSLLGLLLLFMGIFAGLRLSSSPRFLSSSASSDCQPVNPQLSNITHQSFDLSFTTASSCSSSLKVADRIFTNDRQPSFTHYFHVSDLTTAQSYTYTIIAGGTTWAESDSFSLASQPVGQIPVSNLAWGRVFHPDQSPAEGSIVYFLVPGSAPLSALVTANGNWNISLATSFNQDLTSWFTPAENVSEDIVVISPDSQITQVEGNSSRNNPVPDIIIGQSFPQEKENTSSLPSINQSSSDLSSNLKIDNPQDNDSIFSSKPEFLGSGPKNSQIIISVHSPQLIEGSTTSSDQGLWRWTPPQDLSPGEHTITVKSQDQDTGLWQTITHNFTVYASNDDNLAFTSSPSATLVPSLSLRPTSTPAPTLALSPTALPSPVPTTRTAKPATDSAVPITAFVLPTFVTIAIALILLIFSLRYLLI